MQNLIRRLSFALLFALSLSPAFGQAPPPVPALPDVERRTSYSISASTCVCAVNFALFGDSTDYANWLEVFVNGVLIPQSGNWTISSPTGPIATITRPITDAVLTFAAAQTGTVQIVGARRPRRTSQFQESQPVPTRNFNQVFSDIIATQRELWDKTNDFTGRGVFARPGETLALLPILANRMNQGACFDSGGNLAPCVSVPSSTFVAGSGIIFTGTNPTTISAPVPPVNYQPIFNVANYGAAPDYHELATLSAVAGSTVTATGSPFTSSSVGSLINILGAGAAGADYFGTITGFTNANSVTVSPAISTAVTNVYGQFCIDNTTAIQAAVTALRAANGGTIQIPTAGKYCVQQLNITNAPPTILKGSSSVTGSFLIPMRSTNSVIDATGTEAFNMRDLSVGISTIPANPSKQLAVPKVGLLTAPSTQTIGRDFINIENVYWTGRYSLTTAYLDRASSSSMRKVGFSNYQQTPTNQTFGGVMTYNNVLGVTSDFVTTYSGIVNFSDWTFVGCEFHSIDPAGGITNQALLLDNVQQVQFFGGNMSASSSSIVNLAAGTVQNVLFQGVTWYADYGAISAHVFGGVGGMNRVGVYFALLSVSGTVVSNTGTNTNYIQVP